jgi:hypothetical protein
MSTWFKYINNEFYEDMNKCVSLMNGTLIQEFLNGVKRTVQEKHF